MSCMNQPVESI